MGVKVKAQDGAWWAFVNHRGRRKAKRVGVGTAGKKAADDVARKLTAKPALGDDSIFSERPTTAPTFATYARTWLDETIRPHRKPRTLSYYEQIVDSHLLPKLGPVPLTAITRAMVRSLLASKRGMLARNTVKNIGATLRAILFQAQLDGKIPTNPAMRFSRLVDVARDPRRHIAVLEPDDIAAVLETAAKFYPDHALMIETLLFTGMREGELLGLQWDDFDFRRGTVDITRNISIGRGGGLVVTTPKSGEIRTVDLPSPLAARLADLRSVRETEAAVAGTTMSPWLWPAQTDPDRPINDAWLRARLWRPLLTKADVRQVRIHDARHGYASLMLRRGVPVAYVSRQLGHASIQVTVDLYGHFIPGADRHHVDALAAAVATLRPSQTASPAQVSGDGVVVRRAVSS